MTSVRKAQQALAGGLDALTSGVIEGKEAVEFEDYPLASTEMVQHIHVPVTGVAGPALADVEIEVTWPYPIINLMAAGQHESTQETPHFASGAELRTDSVVLLDAQVRSWVQDERDFYTGAIVRLLAWAPGTRKMAHYTGVLHLTFTGYAAAAEDDTDITTPEDIA